MRSLVFLMMLVAVIPGNSQSKYGELNIACYIVNVLPEAEKAAITKMLRNHNGEFEIEKFTWKVRWHQISSDQLNSPNYDYVIKVRKIRFLPNGASFIYNKNSQTHDQPWDGKEDLKLVFNEFIFGILKNKKPPRVQATFDIVSNGRKDQYSIKFDGYEPIASDEKGRVAMTLVARKQTGKLMIGPDNLRELMTFEFDPYRRKQRVQVKDVALVFEPWSDGVYCVSIMGTKNPDPKQIFPAMESRVSLPLGNYEINMVSSKPGYTNEKINILLDGTMKLKFDPIADDLYEMFENRQAGINDPWCQNYLAKPSSDKNALNSPYLFHIINQFLLDCWAKQDYAGAKTALKNYREYYSSCPKRMLAVHDDSDQETVCFQGVNQRTLENLAEIIIAMWDYSFSDGEDENTQSVLKDEMINKLDEIQDSVVSFMGNSSQQSQPISLKDVQQYYRNFFEFILVNRLQHTPLADHSNKAHIKLLKADLEGAEVILW